MRGEVHGDLRPENIIRRERELRWRVLFPCPRRLHGPSTSSQLSTDYTAPEALGSTEITTDSSSAIDMWSYGIISFEVITGKSLLILAGPRGDLDVVFRHSVLCQDAQFLSQRSDTRTHRKTHKHHRRFGYTQFSVEVDYLGRKIAMVCSQRCSKPILSGRTHDNLS